MVNKSFLLNFFSGLECLLPYYFQRIIHKLIRSKNIRRFLDIY